jgi:hypothetical protein
MKSRKRKPSRKPSRPRASSSEQATSRRFVSRGVEVSIVQEGKRVELKMDGVPVHVSLVDGEFHCQLANQFTAFGSIDHIVETLLSNEGRTWTLHGHVCDANCGPSGHHSGGHDHTHSGHHHGHGDGQ